MKAYETSARVENERQIRVTGVPFPAGTEVEVVITAKEYGPTTSPADVLNRVALLFAALDKARNVQPIGKLKRDELYDRTDAIN